MKQAIAKSVIWLSVSGAVLCGAAAEKYQSPLLLSAGGVLGTIYILAVGINRTLGRPCSYLEEAAGDPKSARILSVSNSIH